MQIILYNDNSKTKQVFRVDNTESLFRVADKYPGLKRVILRNAESPDLLKQILKYFNRMHHIQAYLHNDNPMQKSESMKPQNPEVFKTRLHVWAERRAEQAREPLATGILNSQDPGRLSDSKEESPSTNTVLGRLADKFKAWRKGNDNR